MVRVIIVDDHELIRDGFRRILERESRITLVGEAKTADELFRIVEDVKCDVVLLDISLPDRNGIEVLKDLKVRHPDLKVLILSMHPEDHYAKRALSNGASGYISKGTDSQELFKAILEVARGGKYISESYARQIAFEVSRQDNENPHKLLSDREFEVLVQLGQGKSTQEVADFLSININTVYTYRRRIMEKMGFNSTTDLLQYVVQRNLS